MASLKLFDEGSESEPTQINVPDRIREGLDKNPITLDLAREGKTRKWVKDGLILIMAKGERLYVPKCHNFRKELLKVVRWARHPGQELSWLYSRQHTNTTLPAAHA